MAKRQKESSEVQISDSEKLKHYERICELGAAAIQAQREYESRKEALKAFKEDWEHASLSLQQAIERANDPQKELEFTE